LSPRCRAVESSAKQGVDEYQETLDNLASLLLTNTTLRRYRKMQLSLKINSR
jgi:hypothetical protein